LATIEVREAIGTDGLDAIRSLMREYQGYLAGNPAGADGICLTGFEQELAGLPGCYGAPGGVLLLALVDDVAAGCVAVRPARTVAHETACEMKRLWVGERARGLGLGRRLAAAALDWAGAAGYAAMYLDTVPAAMPEANQLYERLGFRPVERYNDNDVTDVVFFRLGLADRE
jgi:GNAT superfamily N-acetyltransferase